MVRQIDKLRTTNEGLFRELKETGERRATAEEKALRLKEVEVLNRQLQAENGNVRA